ncbi:MAG TPA: cytochrome c oxidase subunit II [Bauldia sp.]|nr:cytochrome c oxidase subunit II [Bauldia sp.]
MQWRGNERLLWAPALAVPLAAPSAHAAGPENWQVGFGDPGSAIARLIVDLHDRVVLIGAAIVLIVLGLLVFIALRYRASRNPEASRVARAPLLEFAWTVLPIVIVGLIAVPSLAVLRYEADIPRPELTVKVTGFQWFWRYEYPDHAGVAFDSLMLPAEELEPGQPRLLEVDSRVVVPTGTVIEFLVTSGDVVHSFFIPTLGLQIYAIPGRLNATWVKIDRPGVYYGQCNQICGLDHSFMPIAIEARAPADFEAWLASTRAGSTDGAGLNVPEANLASREGTP